jgi:hypothetical protein
MTRQSPSTDSAARWIGITIVLAAVFVVLLMFAGFMALTGGGGESSPEPVPTSSPSAAASASPTASPGSPSPSSAEVSPSPAASPSPAPSASPAASPSPTPAVSPGPSASPTPTPSGDLAAACSGTDDIDFFRGAAAGLSFDVYCASLPARWYLEHAEWRGTSGGRFEATYRGPGGVTLRLRQGSFCAGDPDCIPSGTDLGSASYGGRPATMRSTDDGFAIVAGEGTSVVYLGESVGLDEATTRSLVAALINLG